MLGLMNICAAISLSGLAHQAAIEGFRSSYSLAAERSLQAIELARRHGWTDEPAAGIAYVILARPHSEH